MHWLEVTLCESASWEKKKVVFSQKLNKVSLNKMVGVEIGWKYLKKFLFNNWHEKLSPF